MIGFINAIFLFMCVHDIVVPLQGFGISWCTKSKLKRQKFKEKMEMGPAKVYTNSKIEQL